MYTRALYIFLFCIHAPTLYRGTRRVIHDGYVPTTTNNNENIVNVCISLAVYTYYIVIMHVGK